MNTNTLNRISIIPGVGTAIGVPGAIYYTCLLICHVVKIVFQTFICLGYYYLEWRSRSHAEQAKHKFEGAKKGLQDCLDDYLGSGEFVKEKLACYRQQSIEKSRTETSEQSDLKHVAANDGQCVSNSSINDDELEAEIARAGADIVAADAGLAITKKAFLDADEKLKQAEAKLAADIELRKKLAETGLNNATQLPGMPETTQQQASTVLNSNSGASTATTQTPVAARSEPAQQRASTVYQDDSVRQKLDFSSPSNNNSSSSTRSRAASFSGSQNTQGKNLKKRNAKEFFSTLLTVPNGLTMITPVRASSDSNARRTNSVTTHHSSLEEVQTRVKANVDAQTDEFNNVGSELIEKFKKNNPKYLEHSATRDREQNFFEEQKKRHAEVAEKLQQAIDRVQKTKAEINGDIQGVALGVIRAVPTIGGIILSCFKFQQVRVP